MKLVLKAATATIAIMTASVTAIPAYAATVVYDGTTYNPNDAIVINFTGVQDPNSSGTLTLTFTGTGTGAQVTSREKLPTGCDVVLKRGSLFAAARVASVSGDEATLRFYRELSDDEIERALFRAGD